MALLLSTLLSLALLPTAPLDDEAAPLPSGGPLRADQACYDVKHYDLSLRVDPATRTIRGSLAVRLLITRATERLGLDLDDRLEVLGVTMESLGPDDTVSHEHAGGRLSVAIPPRQAGQLLTLRVAYGGTPREAPRPPWDGGFTWAETADGSPWIATSCQGEGADLWWPCKDHPSDEPDQGMDLRFTVPDDLVVATNGRLLSIRDGAPGWRTHHFRVSTPINNYGVAFNAAPYRTLTTEIECVDGGRYPFVFYVLPENVDAARAALPDFVDQLRWFEETLGPYPFRADKYGLVETPHLGMEHQSIVAYGNRYRPDRRYDYDWLHHHEASHEWWANLVTADDWRDMWIHEGFGTYMQALFLEDRFGPATGRRKLAGSRRGIKNRRPVAPREVRDSKQIYFAPDGSFDNDIYDKGALVLHTLRWTIGDQAFREGLRRLCYPSSAARASTDGSACRLIDTEVVRATFEAVAGRDLERFFEVFLRRPELPQLAVQRTGDALLLSWRCADGGPLDVPVPLRVDGHDLRREVPQGSAQLVLPPDATLEVDPHGWLLADVVEE